MNDAQIILNIHKYADININNILNIKIFTKNGNSNPYFDLKVER